MARTAFVIGLGGTGQWVLTHLKKDLMESHGGTMPDNVRLLAFDTMPQATAELAATGRQGEKEVKVGSVRLEKEREFVHIGGDCYEIGEAASQGKLPHIGSWFQADYWLANLPRAQWVLSAGAGQLRQFGRLGLFKDLGNPAHSEIWTRLNANIMELAKKLEEQQRLEIIIVGSFAGGTGSGMLLDIALLARYRAGRVPNIIRGYFALPNAFDAEPSEEMKARSFAAWRELNRLMVVSADFSLPRVTYNLADTTLQIPEVRQKVFDACYLIDGVLPGGRRLSAEPEHGVHAAVAAAISALLDEKAGQAYTEWIVTNLGPVYAGNPGVVFYSSLGAHTYKVPVYYSEQDFADRLTLDWLDALVKPVRDDPSDPERVTRVERVHWQDPNRLGYEDALKLLQESQAYEGQSEAPTLFLGEIANVILQGAGENLNLVRQHAEGSLGMQRRRAGFSWLSVFPNLGDRADMAQVIERVSREARLRVMEAVKPGRESKIPPQEWPQYVARVLPPFIREHYGYRTASGEEHRGKFGEVLQQCKDAQVGIFRRLVRLWLMRTLMEGDKAGRVGYAYDLLDGLVNRLKEFEAFMDRVAAMRQELNPRLEAEKERSVKYGQVQEYARKKFLAVLEHPKVHSTQVAYLQAEQAVVDVRKDEILHWAVVETVREMRKYAEALRAELERWIRVLATGDPATGVEGLYATLARKRRELEETRQADQKLSAVQTRLAELEFPKEEVKKEVQRLLRGVQWDLEETDGQVQLLFSIRPEDEVPTTLESFRGVEHPEARKHLTERNLSAVKGYASRRFSHLPAETRVAEHIRRIYGTPQAFAQEVLGKAQPLFDRPVAEQTSAKKWATLVRVSTDDVQEATRQFFQDAVREMRLAKLSTEARDQDKLIDLVGSKDPHKCTVVYTEDLMEPQVFRAWHDCQKAYLEYKAVPPHLNHNFPAEANAAKYELEYSSRHNTQYRVFHPWVVMLLEHPQRLEQFFLSWGLGWIAVEDDGANTWYELRAPGFKHRDGRQFRLTPASRQLWSLFQLAKSFVLEGRDQFPQSTWLLNYERLDGALQEYQREVGLEGWREFLLAQLGKESKVRLQPEQRILAQLQERIRELDGFKESGGALPAGEPANYKDAYTDLAAVAELMLEDLLKSVEDRLARQKRQEKATGPEVGGPAGASGEPPSILDV
ncbi:MAG: tubulin-like doman-containing protein [Anaerolineae bacterium]